MRRIGGGSPSPLGRAPLGVAVPVQSASGGGGSSGAVGFNPLADASQGPAQQLATVGTMLMAPVQATPQLAIASISTTRQLALLAIPPYVGWVQLFPRVVSVAAVPDTALPLRVGYYNGPTPLPANTSQAAIIAWLTNLATPIHTQYSVTLEQTADFVFGTPFSEVAPVFLPAGTNVAVFYGLTTDLSYSATVHAYLTAIAAPRNEQMLLPNNATPA